MNEGARFLHILPRRCRLTGLEADDRVPHAQGVTWLHAQVSGDAVTLVKQADHRNPFSHGRARQSVGPAIADLLPLDLHRTGPIFGGDIIVAAGRK